MSDDRLLNLDDEIVIDVPLGGRTFQIREQRRSILAKVLRAIQPDPDRKLDDDASAQAFVDFSAETFERSLPAFALMLGIEPGDTDYKETVAHLEEHLKFSKAKRLFNKWWSVNGGADFLSQGGNPLIPEETLAAVRAMPETPTESVNED